ncbi:hypothetical protein [Methylotuvimicrobium buryatense]|uniref:NodB homology domain-containing protein n=1 Tax=Methylotuvimicrobium buryatense TaxID=95641 RepID=A0A4P9UQU2_METBY|nr:hypothetical protein [Methylotuvimicrobium buryatense]QCW81986.1 hypothetical protein EQU24_06770 [Methylotuvimicrobium buryatense]
MTLGVVLAIPDAKKIIDSNYQSYYARFLKEPCFSEIKDQMLSGLNRGVFDLQLHGMEHYWPGNLVDAYSSENVRDWLSSSEFPESEGLPSALQSRWIDVTRLPSKPISTTQIKQAVDKEVKEFLETFGIPPKVVVPPTFIWDTQVEKEWLHNGLKYLVTPGIKFNARDERGKPVASGKRLFNGQKSETELIYIVRNDYFEPCLGHTSEQAIQALGLKSQLAQPTLLEIHRNNFTQSPEQSENALQQLESCIRLAIEKYPNIKFLSTFELAEIYTGPSRKSNVDDRICTRFIMFLERIWADSSIKKWLIISGLALPVCGLRLFRKII